MKNKAVLITDGAAPSGAALIKAYAAAGARVAVNCAQAAEHEGAAACYSYDLTTGDGPETLVNRAAGELGGLDIVVHNHNRVVPGTICGSTDGQILAELDYNAKSAFLITQAAGRYMKAHGGGSFLYISSIHGEKPTGSAFAYAAAKAAVKMLARETALDLGAYGVRANVIEMGPVPGDEQLFKSELSRLYDHMEQKIPGGVTGSWDEAARLAVFLTGGACPYINGESVTMDGGFLLHYFFRQSYEEWQGVNA